MLLVRLFSIVLLSQSCGSRLVRVTLTTLSCGGRPLVCPSIRLSLVVCADRSLEAAQPVDQARADIAEDEAATGDELPRRGATSVRVVKKLTSDAVIGVPVSAKAPTPELDGVEVGAVVSGVVGDRSAHVLAVSKTDVGVGVDERIGPMDTNEDTPAVNKKAVTSADGVEPAIKNDEEYGQDKDLEPAVGVVVESAPEPATESKSEPGSSAKKVSNQVIDDISDHASDVATRKMPPIDGSMLAVVDARTLKDSVGAGSGLEDSAAMMVKTDDVSAANASTRDSAEPNKRVGGPVARLRKKFEQSRSSTAHNTHDFPTDTKMKLPTPAVDENVVSGEGQRRPAPVQEAPKNSFEPTAATEDDDIAHVGASTTITIREKMPAAAVEKPVRSGARKARARGGEGGFVAAAVRRLSSQSRDDEQTPDDGVRQQPHGEPMSAGGRNAVAHGGEGAFVVASIDSISAPRVRAGEQSRDNSGRPLLYHGISRYLDSELVFTSPSDADPRQANEMSDVATARQSPAPIITDDAASSRESPTAATDNPTTRCGPASSPTQRASIEGCVEDVNDTDEGTTPGGLSAAVVEAGWVTEYEASGLLMSSGTSSERSVLTSTGCQESGSLLGLGKGGSRTESNVDDPYARDPEDDLPGAVCPTIKICIIS